MVICNSPFIFQQIMDKILDEDIGKRCYVYLDDIIIFGDNEIDHDKNIEIIFEKLNKANLCINKEKWI